MWEVNLALLIFQKIISHLFCLWEALLNISGQIRHMFWGMLFDVNSGGTMLLSGTPIHLGDAYSLKVVSVDCPLLSDERIATKKMSTF